MSTEPLTLSIALRHEEPPKPNPIKNTNSTHIRYYAQYGNWRSKNEAFGNAIRFIEF
jgi:hypothetical protein